MNKLIKKFKYRQLIDNYTKNIKLFFKNKKKIIYFGIDPTSNSLHLGHLLGISILNRLFKLGYKNIIILLGGGTTLIGDINIYNNLKLNKFKNTLIKCNIKKLKKQLCKLLINKKIKILNNYNWLKKINLLYFIVNILKNISVNSILKVKLINNKIKSNNNIYFNEFIYHIIQGYDYLYLNKKYNCNLQLGGSDQWYNIITGIKLIKKKFNKIVNGLTYPLLLNSEGVKFSKSNIINNIWVDENKTSIYDLYQYFINLPDDKAIDYFKKFTFFNIIKTKKIIFLHNKNKKKKKIQKILSFFFINWIYNKKKYKNIKKIMNILFLKKKKIKDIVNNFYLIKKFIKILKIKIKKNNKKYIYIYDIIKYNKIIFKSYNNYKNFIKNNGIFLINCKQINNNIIYLNNLIYNKYLLIQKGKKNFFLLNFIYY